MSNTIYSDNWIKGIVICGGSVSGRLIYKPSKNCFIGNNNAVIDIDIELLKLENALDNLQIDMDELSENQSKQIRDIVDAQKMILSDEEYLMSVRTHINSGLSVTESIKRTCEEFCVLLQETEDEYLVARSNDIKEISGKLISIINNGINDPGINDAGIYVFDELYVSDFLRMDKTKIRGVILLNGSEISHISILLKAYDIPSMIYNVADDDADADRNFADMNNHMCSFNADDAILYFDVTKEEFDFDDEIIEEIDNQVIANVSDSPLKVNLNVAVLEQCNLVNKAGYSGIGLFRTEFEYMASKDFPDEEQLFNIYKQAVINGAGKQVVFRTADIGADKQVSYMKLANENNPAMGLRGIRYSLENIDMFKTQLSALYRASKYGNLAILFPMISNLDEVIRAREICNQVKQNLIDKGIEINHEVPIGIMIETPGAALIADELASHADFFSIGTNDLCAFALGIDRENSKLKDLLLKNNDAIFKLIGMAADSARKAGIPVSICGELASDIRYYDDFVNLGITGISISDSDYNSVWTQLNKM